MRVGLWHHEGHARISQRRGSMDALLWAAAGHYGAAGEIQRRIEAERKTVRAPIPGVRPQTKGYGMGMKAALERCSP